VSSSEAVLQVDGQSFIVPISEIDPDKVELACNDDGCALIEDDGNPHNDVIAVNSNDPQSTHGFALNEVGGNVQVAPCVDAEIAAAAISPTEAIVQYEGQTFHAPIMNIDADAVELACNDGGCVLIPDDGNPYNDITAMRNSETS